jgi:hypothetical protein
MIDLVETPEAFERVEALSSLLPKTGHQFFFREQVILSRDQKVISAVLFVDGIVGAPNAFMGAVGVARMVWSFGAMLQPEQPNDCVSDDDGSDWKYKLGGHKHPKILRALPITPGNFRELKRINVRVSVGSRTIRPTEAAETSPRREFWRRTSGQS